jgi:hypothetical protein
MISFNRKWLILNVGRLHESVKNVFPLYAECILPVPDLFFAYNGQKYARYLTMFSTLIANIDETHPRSLDTVETRGIQCGSIHGSWILYKMWIKQWRKLL